MTTTHTLSGFSFTYSNVMSTVAVFFAIGGAGSPRRAGRADSAGHADSASRADCSGSAARADTATTATNAAHATTADSATVASSLTEPEPIHFLNTNGEPKTQNVEVDSPLGYYVDHEGVVHLQGRFKPLVDTTMFGARVVVCPDGAVEFGGVTVNDMVSLSGVTQGPPGGPEEDASGSCSAATPTKSSPTASPTPTRRTHPPTKSRLVQASTTPSGVQLLTYVSDGPPVTGFLRGRPRPQVAVRDDAEAADHHVGQADRVCVGDHPV